MTSGAVLRRGFIEQDSLGRNNPCQLVTLRTANILVCPTQREGRSLVVIKQGRLPLR